MAADIKNLVTKTEIRLDDHQWGLDHGAWSVVRNMYPKANVPVIQMSLDYNQTPQYHYELAKELAALRKKSVLIVGSGNLVHNLRMIAWDKFNVDGFGFDWAIEANERMKDYILTDNHQALIDFKNKGKHLIWPYLRLTIFYRFFTRLR